MKTLKNHLMLFDAGRFNCIVCNKVLMKTGSQTIRYGLPSIFRLDLYIAYFLFTWLFTAFILSHYTVLMCKLLPSGHDYREYVICAGQLVFQGAIAGMTHKGKVWDYLGNMMAISFGGALLLLPMTFIAQWINIGALFYVGWFFIVVGLMFMEHIRRIKIMRLGWTLTVSWAFYRFVILLFILFT